jgi:hypothetical protein
MSGRASPAARCLGHAKASGRNGCEQCTLALYRPLVLFRTTHSANNSSVVFQPPTKMLVLLLLIINFRASNTSSFIKPAAPQQLVAFQSMGKMIHTRGFVCLYRASTTATIWTGYRLEQRIVLVTIYLYTQGSLQLI